MPEAKKDEVKAKSTESEEDKDHSSVSDIAKKARDEFNKISLGFFYAGLESIKVTAEMTETFVTKTYELNSPSKEKRDTVTKRIAALPADMMEASIKVLEDSIDKSGQIVDKFYEKYREK